jgi:hypothetical protein
MKIDVQVIAENAAKPVTLMFPGPRGMCSCGWIGKARWTVYGARIDAELHRDDIGHGLADPLVLDSSTTIQLCTSTACQRAPRRSTVLLRVHMLTLRCCGNAGVGTITSGTCTVWSSNMRPSQSVSTTSSMVACSWRNFLLTTIPRCQRGRPQHRRNAGLPFRRKPMVGGVD